MGKVRRNHSGKHADDFKRRLVAESRVEGATVPMVSKRHGVSAGQIYAWRSDGRFDRKRCIGGPKQLFQSFSADLRLLIMRSVAAL